MQWGWCFELTEFVMGRKKITCVCGGGGWRKTQRPGVPFGHAERGARRGHSGGDTGCEGPGWGRTRQTPGSTSHLQLSVRTGKVVQGGAQKTELRAWPD